MPRKKPDYAAMRREVNKAVKAATEDGWSLRAAIEAAQGARSKPGWEGPVRAVTRLQRVFVGPVTDAEYRAVVGERGTQEELLQATQSGWCEMHQTYRHLSPIAYHDSEREREEREREREHWTTRSTDEAVEEIAEMTAEEIAERASGETAPSP